MVYGQCSMVDSVVYCRGVGVYKITFWRFLSNGLGFGDFGVRLKGVEFKIKRFQLKVSE
jgi:hypothetical protein